LHGSATRDKDPGSIERLVRTADPTEHVEDHPKAKRIAIATLAVGLVILLAVGALVLRQAPPRLVRIGAPGSRAVTAQGVYPIEQTIGSPTVCQAGEVLPAGVSAVRVAIWGFFGARVHVGAYSGSHLLTEGARAANWTSDSVTVPVRPLRSTHSGVKVCVAIGPNSEPELVLGAPTPQQQAAEVTEGGHSKRLPGRFTLEYLAPGHSSWWSQILPVARHIGLGRSYSGTWIALLIAFLTATAGVLAIRLSLWELP
jgi:hypothetical protein